MTSRGVLCLVLGLACATWRWNPVAGKITDETEAAQWLREQDRKLAEVNNNAMTASWNYNVNLTDHNDKLQIAASLRRSQFQKEIFRDASRYDWQNFRNHDLVRRFRKLSIIGCDILPNEDVQELDSLRSRMQRTYSTAQVCNRPSTVEADASGARATCYQQNPELTRIVATSRNWDELLWAWKGWRDVTGKKMKSEYVNFVKLLNKGARLNNFTDNGAYWRSVYEMENFGEVCERLWEQVKPLYQHLHAYVRRKLMAKYSGNLKDFPRSRHIPAHLTGNMWAQTWSNILHLVTPFPNSTVLDITRILKDRGFNALRMFREADSFFQSLGLPAMPNEFWERSMIEKPTDGREVVCHASAWDFFNGEDFRIKQCTDVTGDYLITTHHEMGHVQYYLHYRHLPIVYRKGANPGFHEAVGDVIALSVNTPEHLQKIGLLRQTSDSKESELNFLMKQALDKIAFLPYGYLIDRWRWDVFEGRTTPQSYNRDYWKLRCQLQGISPPVPRSEEDFDIGAKFHVPHNTPYIRYFMSYIIQFQFHKSLCDAAGHVGPLHKCDIYNSREAGYKLSSMLRLGSSEPWPEAMEVLTGQRDMDAGPLLQYFQPLHDWLEKENKGEEVTWEEDCPMESFTSRTRQGAESMESYVLTVAALLVALRVLD